jgi:hypothetical protein
MAVYSLTEAVDNLYTTTWQNMKSKVADNIFDATPFWFWLKEQGGLESEEGGRFLTEPLRYASSDNVKFVQKGDTVDLTDKEFLTAANYDWRYLVDSIVRFGIDDQQNRGKNQILSLMRAKLDNSQDSLVDRMETQLFQGASDEAGIGFHGLEDIVPADPTVTGATLGGIDPSVQTWWRNQTTDLTGISFAASGVSNMSNMNNKCMNNRMMDRPDVIVCGQTAYETYLEETITQKRIMNKTLGDASFEAVEFEGLPMIWSPSEDSTSALGTGVRMYFLNTRFLKFRYDPQMFFDMTEWKAIPNQVQDRVAQVITAGNLVTGRRRVHGVIHTIDTA